MSPSNSYAEALIPPHMIVFGGEAFERHLVHGGATTMMGLVPLEKET